MINSGLSDLEQKAKAALPYCSPEGFSAEAIGHLKTVWNGTGIDSASGKRAVKGGLFGTTDDIPTTVPELADFIAACSPAVVLAWIAIMRAMEARTDQLAAQTSSF